MVAACGAVGGGDGGRRHAVDGGPHAPRESVARRSDDPRRIRRERLPAHGQRLRRQRGDLARRANPRDGSAERTSGVLGSPDAVPNRDGREGRPVGGNPSGNGRGLLGALVRGQSSRGLPSVRRERDSLGRSRWRTQESFRGGRPVQSCRTGTERRPRCRQRYRHGRRDLDRDGEGRAALGPGLRQWWPAASGVDAGRAVSAAQRCAGGSRVRRDDGQTRLHASGTGPALAVSELRR